MCADGGTDLRRRRPAELEAAEGGETAGVVALVDRRVVAGVAGPGGQAQYLASRAVGPLVEREVFPQVDFRVGILERAEHLLERRLDQISLGGQKGVVAFVLGQRHLEPVQGQVAVAQFAQQNVMAVDVLVRGNQRIDRIAEIDLRAAVGDGAREVGAELVSQTHPAAQPLLGIFVVDAGVVVSAQAQGHRRVEQVRLFER